MPDIITHYRFGDAVYRRLLPKIQANIRRNIFDIAAIGPDVWFSYRFWLPRAQRGKPERGNVMQHSRTGDFLLALAAAAREDAAREELFSYLSGFLCHYCLDRTTHPYLVYRSGDYDGTPETLAYRGNHMRLEHALDLRALAAWGRRLSQFPVTRRILRLRKLPASMRASLNGAYRQVYGWESAWTDLNQCILDQRRFYFLAQDPCGLLDAILQRADNGKSRVDLTAVSYHGKEMPKADLTNEARLPWRHPFDPSVVSRESFDDLTERAAQDAAVMISTARAFLAGAKTSAELALSFGSASYETGFDWRDPRNLATPVCEPLILGRE